MNLNPFWNVISSFYALFEATRNPENDNGIYSNLRPNLSFSEENRNLNFSKNRCVYQLMACFEVDVKEKVKDALDHIHADFHNYQKRLIEILLPEHQQFLMRKIQGAAMDQNRFRILQDEIQEFHYYTQYLFDEERAGTNARLTEIFKNHFCDRCYDHIDSLKESNSIISLNAQCNGEVPYKAIIEASFKDKKSDSVAIEKFAKSASSKDIEVSLLHDALRAIVSHASSFHQTNANVLLGQAPDLAELESSLYNIQKRLFTQVDTEHVVWRDSLKENMKIKATLCSNGESFEYTIVLGKQIGKKSNPDDDTNILFEIDKCLGKDNDLSKIMQQGVLWITINKALPGIKFVQAQQSTFMKPAAIHAIDSEGRFAIIDKLKPFPNESSFYTFLGQGWLKWLVNNSLCPDRLNETNYMLTESTNTIASVKITKALDSFSFVKFEKLIFNLSRGDAAVFSCLVNESGLCYTDDAKYLKNVAENAFQMTFDFKREAIGKAFKDQETPAYALSLITELLKMRDTCHQILKANGKELSNERLESTILLKFKAKESISFVWPTLQAEVIKELS